MSYKDYAWTGRYRHTREELEMAQGLPVLRGPFVVDYTDIPHDGDKMTLWTPQVGDVLLRLVVDVQASTPFDHGGLYVGQNVDGTPGGNPHNCFAFVQPGNQTEQGALDLGCLDIMWREAYCDGTGHSVTSTGYVFHTTDPVQIQLAQTGGTDPTQGHVELYALIARAVAP